MITLKTGHLYEFHKTPPYVLTQTFFSHIINVDQTQQRYISRKNFVQSAESITQFYHSFTKKFVFMCVKEQIGVFVRDDDGRKTLHEIVTCCSPQSNKIFGVSLNSLEYFGILEFS